MTDEAESGGASSGRAAWIIPGSERPPAAGALVLGPVPRGQRAEVTVVLRRRAELPASGTDDTAGTESQNGSVLGKEQLAAVQGADPSDVASVREVFTSAGLDVLSEDLLGRRVIVAGPVERLAATFGTELSLARAGDAAPGEEFRHRSGPLSVPAALAGIVVAVLGLDERPQTRTRLRAVAPEQVSTSYTAAQLATLYQFPAGTDGAGQSVAVIELGGGFVDADLDTYFSTRGLPRPRITAAGVDGAGNTPTGDAGGPDGEVMLDLEVIGAAAPAADQIVYFAPNTDRGFLDAVTTAIQADPTPVAVSISWGAPEDSWTGQARTAMDQAFADAVALGITVCVASGDGGSGDGESRGAHVDFPAASPHALACGGTTLRADAAGATISSETVWTGSGGGVSAVFDQPHWQAGLQVPARPGGGTGRGVPDVAAVADPATGYQVRVDGTDAVYGGTSAVAPLWSALLARLAQAGLPRSSTLAAQLYTGGTRAGSPAGFRDVVSGSNGAYQAATGWDACSGNGVPVGTQLLARLLATGPGASPG